MAQEYSPSGSDSVFTIPSFGEVVNGEDVFRRFADDVVTSPPGSVSVGVRHTFISPGDPTPADGEDGDVWLKYV